MQDGSTAPLDEEVDEGVGEADTENGVAAVADAGAAENGEAEDLDDDEPEEPSVIDPRERNTIALLLQELGDVSLLTREEEQAIGLQLVRCRVKLGKLLSGEPHLIAAALPSYKILYLPLLPLARVLCILPEEVFRERDAVAVLNYTDRLVSDLANRTAGQSRRRELRRFAVKLSDALLEYRGLRDQLIRANIRLVISLAKRYRRNGVALADMVQEGILGLIRAVEKYDPVRDVKFATYAVWWIWQQIGRAGDIHAALIRTPVHWNQLRRKLGRESVRLEHVNGGNIARETLAEATGIDAQRLDAITQSFYCVSLDSPASEDEDRSLADMLPSPLADPERERTAVDLSERLEAALCQLPGREAEILRLRFGTAREHALTLEEVGQMLGVSRERVRQLEARALRLLLPICQTQGLRSYID